ncbi:MAG: hypothetical protein M0Z54_06020 [Thermaerobacter sp.]|nr:hypothetical protein [Thermaerobacter sp.]
MTGVLLASHSKRLAEGLKELVDELCHGAVPVVAVGGGNPLGVSVEMVMEGVRALLAQPGVDAGVALGDLGGALVALETAVEIGHLEGQLLIADAPLVEGAVAAVMAAAIGEGPEAVAAAAAEAGQLPKR